MIDLDSDTWRDVAAFVTDAIEQATAELRSPALDYPNTQRVRGQLLALASVLNLPATQHPGSEFPQPIDEGPY